MAATNFTPISLYYSTTAATAPVAGNLVNGELAINITDGKLYYKNNSGVVTLLASTLGASGDVVGPASATDNALARFDLTTGKLIQNSVGILSDAGILTGLTGLTSSGPITFSSLTSGRVVYSSGQLVDSAAFTYAGVDLVLSSGDIVIGAGPSATARMFRAIEVGVSGNTAGIAFGNAGGKGAVYGQSGSTALSIVSGNSGAIAFGYAVSGDAGASANFNSLGAWTTTGLGVGTATPTSKLGVLSNQAVTNNIATSSTATGASTNNYAIYADASGGTNNYGVYSVAAKNYFSGNVGIGVTNPTQTLQLGNATAVEIDSLIAGTRTSTLYTDNSQFIIETATNINMIFNTNATQRMVITGAGLVGIGTSSPNNNLEVYSSSNPSIALTSTSASLYSYFGMTSGTVGAQLYTFGQSYSAVYPAGSTALANDTYGIILNASNASGILRFQTNATERMRIDAAGNVGIGVTPSAWQTALGSRAIQFTGSSVYGYRDTNILLVQNAYLDSTTGGWKYYASSIPAAYSDIGSGAFGWFQAASGTAGNAVTFTQAMALNTSGFLGIGTSSPAYKLQVYTDADVWHFVAGGATGNVRIGGQPSGGGVIGAYTPANVPRDLLLQRDGASLIVGATGTVGSGGKMQVYSTVDTFYVQSNVNAPYSAIIANVQYTACNLVAFQYGTPLTNVGAISTNGTITIYGTTSDYRLKENVVPMTGALATVAQLKPVAYKWKSDGSDGQGFIAHELQAVVPDAVHGQKDAVDADGNPVYQNVDTSHLIATLTAAIQEQQALIESLTTRITNLENK